MEDFKFNDRPNHQRIEGSKSEISTVETAKVSLFLDLQWAYRDMQKGFDKVLQEYQLSESRFIILMFLKRAENQQLLPTEIARKLGATKATVSKLLNSMAALGWVDKSVSELDRRATNIQLTAAGAQKLEEFLPANFKTVETIMAHLTIEETAQLSALLEKVNAGTRDLAMKTKENENDNWKQN